MNQQAKRDAIDLDRNLYGYDLASNRLWNKNVVAATGQDEFYAYDGLYQVKTFQRGTLNTGHTGLTGTPAWEEDFTFDPTGNWTNYVQQTAGVPTLTQPRTHNQVNEIETIGGSSSTIAQDAAGNITKAPVPVDWSSAYTMVYDAWSRLVAVKSGSTVVASFAYDGQNWRTTQTTSGPTVRHYYYTSSWQIVEERVGTSTSPERQYVWGLLGGIDNLVLRDRPGSSERLYAMSDALGSVTALTNASGTMEERYGYYAFGFPRFMNASFGIISSSAYDWNVLYASYRRDSETGYYQVRNRYLHPGLGRWLTRDPIGYDGGINLYAYVGNSSVNWTDPMGLLFGLIPILGTIEHLIEISLSDVDGTKTSDYTVHQDWAQEACKQDIAEQEFSKLAAFGAAGVLRDVVEYVSGTLIAYLGENWIAKIFGGIIDFDAVIESLVLNDAKEKFDYAAEQAKRECKCPR